MFYRPLILFTCTLSVASAQEIIQLDKIQIEDHYSVIEERRDHSIAKRIFKGEELSQYGDMNAQEMLKRLPGVTINEGKGKKGAPGKGYTKVLIDGEEVTSTRRGNPLENITPEMIERLEVMTNGSAEYSAESMGGIVNIVLKSPVSSGKTMARLSLGAYEGEPMGSIFAQYEGKKEKLSYLFNVTASDNSQQDFSSTYYDDGGENSESKGRYRALNMRTKLMYTPNRKDKYAFEGSLNLNNSLLTSLEERNRTLNETVHIGNEGDAAMIWTKLSGTHNLSGNELIEWRLKYHQNESQGDTQTRKTLSDATQEDENRFNVFGVDGAYSIALDNHFIKMGVDIKRLDQKDSVDTYLNGTLDTRNVQTLQEDKGALFIQDEMNVGENIVLTPGLRYEYSDRTFEQGRRFSYFAPSLHTLYRIDEKNNLRGSIAKTVKLPRLNELSGTVNKTLDANDLNHPDVSGNANLAEESALSYEVRYEHFFDDKGIVSIGGFYRDISDKIEKLTTLESGRYIERPYNAGEGKLWSLELELKKSLHEMIKGFGIFANASIQNSSLQNDGTKSKIKGTHDYIYSVGFDHRLNEYKFSYGATYRYLSGYDDQIDSRGIHEMQDGYGTLDLYLRKTIDEHFRIGLNLKNITQETITTTSKRYSGGVLSETQIDNEKSQFHFVVTLEGRW